MAILADACADLRAKGVRLVYLILDDHPPLGTCHARHLNETIPALLEQCGAVCMSLQGWDHPRRVVGKVERHGGFHPMRLDRSFTSKFALHPALWQLDVLEKMTLHFLAMSPPGKSPWDFERLSGDPHAAFPDEWKTSALRICGSEMEMRPLSFAARALRRASMSGARAAHSLARWITGEEARASARKIGVDWERLKLWRKERRRRLKKKFNRDYPWLTEISHKKMRRILEEKLRVNDVIYRGPYPMVFTGVLRRGAVNPFLMQYLGDHDEMDFRDELMRATAGLEKPL